MARKTSLEESQSSSYAEVGNIFVYETDKYITFYKIIEDLNYGFTYDKIIVNKQNDKYEIIKRYNFKTWAAPGQGNFIKEEDFGNFLKKRVSFSEDGIYQDKLALLYLLI